MPKRSTEWPLMRAGSALILLFAVFDLFSNAHTFADVGWWAAKWFGINLIWAVLNLVAVLALACWNAWRTMRFAGRR